MNLGYVINMAISLSLLYLIFSLLCTFINEIISSMLSLRSGFLSESFDTLASNSPKLTEIKSHPSIDAVVKDGKIAQAYLPGQTFAQATLDIINPKAQKTDNQTYDAIIDGINSWNDDDDLKKILRSVINNTSATPQDVRNAIANWFDTKMEHTQGLYKKYMKWIAISVGVVIAVAFNINTIQVARFLWQDNGEIASRIAASVSSDCISGKKPSPIGEAAGGHENTKSLCDAYNNLIDNMIKNRDNPEPNKTFKENNIRVIKEINMIRSTFAPLPIGWREDNSFSDLYHDFFKLSIWEVIIYIIGWLLTAVALSLGANFWFDTLNKFINIRCVGSKPEVTPSSTNP